VNGCLAHAKLLGDLLHRETLLVKPFGNGFALDLTIGRIEASPYGERAIVRAGPIPTHGTYTFHAPPASDQERAGVHRRGIVEAATRKARNKSPK
jgi:hypothetical protein